jgi:hypothetical protein
MKKTKLSEIDIKHDRFCTPAIVGAFSYILGQWEKNWKVWREVAGVSEKEYMAYLKDRIESALVRNLYPQITAEEYRDHVTKPIQEAMSKKEEE